MPWLGVGMQKLSSLVRKAQDIRRRIWASLPFGYRLARVFVSLSNEFLTDWGRQLGAHLLKLGIQDMPDPGPSWNPDKPDPRRLPRGYMKSEAGLMYQIALRKLGNPEDAVDLLQDIIIKLVTGGINITEGVPLKMAISYIGRGVSLETLRRLRNKSKRPIQVDMGGDEDRGPLQIEDTRFLDNPYWVEEPKAYQDISGLFDSNIWRSRVVPELARIHPDVPLFFSIMLENPNMTFPDVVSQLPHFNKSDKTWRRILHDKVGPKLKELSENLS
jgi:hypothetical protein